MLSKRGYHVAWISGVWQLIAEIFLDLQETCIVLCPLKKPT